MPTTHTPENMALWPQTNEEQEERRKILAAYEAKHYPERFLALENPQGIFKGTREEWLEAAAVIMGGWIDYALSQNNRVSVHKGRTSFKVESVTFGRWLCDRYGGKISDYRFNPKTTRYACSLQASGMAKASSLAHVHYAWATGNRFDEIRMSVELGGRQRKGESSRVADVLLHEMIHTCAVHHGHAGAFKQLATTMGLAGPMTATHASDDLAARIWDDVVSRLGRYPHKAVHMTPRGKRGKGSRLKKCLCPSCGFNFRTTQKWLSAADHFLRCPIGCDVEGGMLIEGISIPIV